MRGLASDRGVKKRGQVAALLTVLAVGVGFVAATSASAATTTTSSAPVPGVTDNSVTLGIIYPKGGPAGPLFASTGPACQARIDRENANGGVNGRKIKLEEADDSGSQDNLAAAKDLVQQRNVFAVINDSSFAFLGYRYLLDSGVPMIGGGFDGNEYGKPGGEELISMLGNNAPVYGQQYTNLQTLLKKYKVKKMAALAYGLSPSSSEIAKTFQDQVVKGIGADPAYTNTAVDFGSTDVSPIVLGMKNAGVDSVYLPMIASTNFAILQGARQNGIPLKFSLMSTGYGQDVLDDPVSQILTPHDLFLQQVWAPVEAKTKGTKQFQADLKKYANATGVPNFGQYVGYISCDLAIAGLKAAGKDLTRQGFIDATKGLKDWRSADLGCMATDLSREGFGKAAEKNCAWFLYVKDGKFVPINNGKPYVGKLIKATAGTTTTTTEAASTPSS